MAKPVKDSNPPPDEIEIINGVKYMTTRAWNRIIDILFGNDSEKIPQNAIKNLVVNLTEKINKSSIVSVFQGTPDDSHIPSEKLLKDSIDTISLTPGAKGDKGDTGKSPQNKLFALDSQLKKNICI